ncbi:MAG TPA: flagellar hook-length control protein FliK [Azonexus sp.]|nr:flagellar hook-length control protein FliK [Azonexus sp.]
MIPPDVANNLRLIVPDQQLNNAQAQPVTRTQAIADVLSDLVPGQRILAEIQSLLPNGTYRAVVAQRDVTLALPFSAKPGDSLELEVTESNGKLTLAVVSNRPGGAAEPATAESVSTSLSPAGKLIGGLLNDISGDGRRAPPAILNNSAPIFEQLPKTAQEMMPILKQALTQSGMFYEAHQARWVAGELPTEALQQEPQGKLQTNTPVAITAGMAQAADGDTSAKGGITSTSLPASAAGPSSDQAMLTNSRIPHELTSLVQQQLDGLSTQNFVWQGQIWPGQDLRWEIGDDARHARTAGDAESRQWQTRLKLSLPKLGQIDAQLSLNAGGEVSLSLLAGSDASAAQLRDQSTQLAGQFAAAGLRLTQLAMQKNEQAEQ